MQQGIGPPKRLQQVHAPGQVVAELVQPTEQAAAQRALLRSRIDLRWSQGLEHGDRIAQVRDEERCAQVAAVVPALGHHGVAGGAGVELSDEINDRRDGFRVRMRGVQRSLTQVFVHMPHAAAVPLRRRGEQAGGTGAQSQGGQPAPQHELVAAREPGIEPLQHERARAAVRPSPQAIDPGLQALELGGALVRTVVREQLPQHLAEFGPTGFGGARDRGAGWRAGIDHVSASRSRTASASRSCKTRSQAVGRLRYSARSYASSGLTQRIPASCRKIRPTTARRCTSLSRT